MHFNPQLFKVSIIQTKLFGPLDFELSRLHCISKYDPEHEKIYFIIALDKSRQKNIFLFPHENIGCGYSLEAPHLGA